MMLVCLLPIRKRQQMVTRPGSQTPVADWSSDRDSEKNGSIFLWRPLGDSVLGKPASQTKNRGLWPAYLGRASDLGRTRASKSGPTR